MYNTDNLIPAKFLTLVAHLAISTTLIWSSRESTRTCLPDGHTSELFDSQHTQLIWGLSVSLVLIGFELCAFLSGLTMFHSTSALLSIGCHGFACLVLGNLVFSGWHCGWYWIVLGLFSVLPVVNDLAIMVDIVYHKKY